MIKVLKLMQSRKKELEIEKLRLGASVSSDSSLNNSEDENETYFSGIL